MPKAIIIQASVGPPKETTPEPSDEILPSISRAETLIPSGVKDATENLLLDVSQKLAFSQGTGTLPAAMNAEDRNARKRKALQKCSDIFVSYGPNDRTVFISPYIGFEMSRTKQRTLFDTYYKDAQLKIRKYYITAEGDELGIHEDSSGRAGWTWLNSPKSSATNYGGLKKWLTQRQSESPDIFATTTVAFGGPGTYFARCGIYYWWCNVPFALKQAFAARTKDMDPESSHKFSTNTRFWKASPKIVALGADETYFVLWSDDSYQYGLEMSCRLMQTIKSHPQHIRTLTNLFLSPTNSNRYFLVAEHGLRTLSVTHPKLMRTSSRVDAHYQKCLAEFPTEFGNILHQATLNKSQSYNFTDDSHKKVHMRENPVEVSSTEHNSKSKGRFSLFRLSKSATDIDVETVKQAQ